MASEPTPVMAHRGASAEFPEHTLAAFERAIEVGAQGIETDVHLNRDGHAVCIHDHLLERTSNSGGFVENRTLAELRELDYGSWREWSVPEGSSIPAEHGHSLMTLSELLDLVIAGAVSRGRVLNLAIETKQPSRASGKLEQAVADELRAHGLLHGPTDAAPVAVRVMCFQPEALARMAVLAPSIPLVQLWEYPNEGYLAGEFPEHIRISGPSIQLLREHPDLVGRARERGITTHPWTIDRPEDVAHCLALGVEMITTNRPGEVLAQVAQQELATP